nr:hypothetical protein Itr_chr02CG07110 [Ipomoea trifida]
MNGLVKGKTKVQLAADLKILAYRPNLNNQKYSPKDCGFVIIVVVYPIFFPLPPAILFCSIPFPAPRYPTLPAKLSIIFTYAFLNLVHSFTGDSIFHRSFGTAFIRHDRLDPNLTTFTLFLVPSTRLYFRLLHALFIAPLNLNGFITTSILDLHFKRIEISGRI